MRIVLLIWGVLLTSAAFSQNPEEDSTGGGRRFINNIFHQLRNAVTVSQSDSLAKTVQLSTKSEQPFLRYEGRIIRHIYTEEMGFEKTFADTSRRIAYFGTNLLNSLHTNTKSWVIRDNLFIKENTRLNPYKVADNERYLRSINFIQDARILVKPVRGSRDSIDLLIVTKDLFSITGSLSASRLDKVRGRIAETNLGGMGQTVQVSVLYDETRSPRVGNEVVYTKNNIAGSFVNGSIGYSYMNTGPSIGLEDERAFFLELERPLISPYSKLAGGLTMSFNSSQNPYKKPDDLFYDYRYNIYDVWAGFNLGASKLLDSKNQERNRRFLAGRYFVNHFNKMPEQIGDKFDPVYNDKKGILGEFTFFRQEFVKTNYIYGFGTTEDVPYGFNISATGGWFKQLNLSRPYAGLNGNHYVYTDKGEFFQYFLRTGVFFNKRRWEDASVLVGVNFYSKLLPFRDFMLRDYLKFSYTNLTNRVTSEPLRIDNPLGLQYFTADSVLGAQRLSLYNESYLISDYKLLGFRFSPFLFFDVTALAREKTSLFRSNVYAGIGGGMRTRNENLVFGTIELRMMYFPRVAEDMSRFKIRLKSNLRFRYNSRYIKAPDLIQLNNDEANNIY